MAQFWRDQALAVQRRRAATYLHVWFSASLVLALAISAPTAAGAGLRTRHEQPLTCESAASAAATKAASKPVVAALTRLHPPVEVYSHHAVLIAPTDPLKSGGGFAADGYAALPRIIKDGNFSTAFTKFVVVSHGRKLGLDGITFGADVCGAAQLTDKIAADYFRSDAMERLGHYVPRMLSCAKLGNCEQHELPIGVASQLPFLAAISGPGSPLKNNVLPVVLHGQGVRLAARLGDALSLLVQPGGVWEAERVLFVFSGDLSLGLAAVQADLCDTKTAELVSERGVPQIASYFDGLLKGQAQEGCPGPAAAPRGYAPMLAAARVAENLDLANRRAVVAHDAPPGGDEKPGWKSFSGPVLGSMYVIFWKELRSPGEKIAAEASLLMASSPRRPAASSETPRGHTSSEVKGRSGPQHEEHLVTEGGSAQLQLRPKVLLMKRHQSGAGARGGLLGTSAKEGSKVLRSNGTSSPKLAPEMVMRLDTVLSSNQAQRAGNAMAVLPGLEAKAMHRAANDVWQAAMASKDFSVPLVTKATVMASEAEAEHAALMRHFAAAAAAR